MNVVNGVYNYKKAIQTIKKGEETELSYSIFSPLFLLIMIVSLYKFDSTIALVSSLYNLPSKLFGKRKTAPVKYSSKRR